jgi:hypothetical protein
VRFVVLCLVFESFVVCLFEAMNAAIGVVVGDERRCSGVCEIRSNELECGSALGIRSGAKVARFRFRIGLDMPLFLVRRRLST